MPSQTSPKLIELSTKFKLLLATREGWYDIRIEKIWDSNDELVFSDTVPDNAGLQTPKDLGIEDNYLIFAQSRATEQKARVNVSA